MNTDILNEYKKYREEIERLFFFEKDNLTAEEVVNKLDTALKAERYWVKSLVKKVNVLSDNDLVDLLISDESEYELASKGRNMKLADLLRDKIHIFDLIINPSDTVKSKHLEHCKKLKIKSPYL